MLKGYTVDISESGISAMLRLDVPLGEVVELEFTLAFGPVSIVSVVRQRNAFRYGFQFLESSFVNQVIRSTCRQLAVEQSLKSPDGQCQRSHVVLRVSGQIRAPHGLRICMPFFDPR